MVSTTQKKQQVRTIARETKHAMKKLWKTRVLSVYNSSRSTIDTDKNSNQTEKNLMGRVQLDSAIKFPS